MSFVTRVLSILTMLCLDFNADVIFLQECETEFFEEDLKSSMVDYQFHLKLKGEKAKEGEAILFRSDKFKSQLFYSI